MGIGFRVFLMDDDLSGVVRIPLSRFDRLKNNDPNEKLVTYAGKKVRYALVTINISERRPVSIIRIDCGFLKFKDSGSIDALFLKEEAKSLMETLSTCPVLQDGTPNVIDARNRFALRRYSHKFTWAITKPLEMAIHRMIFERKKL